MLRRKRIAEDKDLASLEDKRLKTEASVLEESNTIKQTNLDVKNDTKENRDEVEPISTVPESVPDKILLIEQELCNKLRNIVFQSSVEYIYNPLEYASEPHAMYVRKYCTGAKKILFVGMNPGPWGMSQTGVPFGEIKMVRDWLKISGSVGNPAKEHPDRKVTGFQCTRSEISGQRLWGLFKELCGDSENFFQYTYVHNYCPYALMNANARNITPAELKAIFISTIIYILMLNYLLFSESNTKGFTPSVRQGINRHCKITKSRNHCWHWQICREKGTNGSSNCRSFSKGNIYLYYTYI